MTNKQKIWLSIFLAMFLIPEILWSQFANTLFYGIKAIITNNWGPVGYIGILPIPQTQIIVKLLLLIKFLGLLLSFLVLVFFYQPTNKTKKNIIVAVFFIPVLTIFYFLIAAFSFTMQIG